jgi:hypothetical protein
MEVHEHRFYCKVVEMQDAQGYVARCTTLSTSSFCLVVWSARLASSHMFPTTFWVELKLHLLWKLLMMFRNGLLW